MGEPSTFRYWNRPATPEEIAAEQKRERRRNWVRPASIVVVLGVVVVDGLVLLVASGIQSAVRVRDGIPCSTFWTGLAHDTLTSLWIVLGLVLVSLIATARWRWVLVAVVVVQVALLAFAVPGLLNKRAQYLDVASGRLSATRIDTNGVACTP